MKHYVDSCTACTMKDAKIELLTQELNEYKKYDRRKERKSRGTIPWDEPYERRKNSRYPPSGYD
jgi:hypothetical protein|tara:strand:- start:154 stop:345 length:192 start_codon:yes stop_codon:yes gene_type:complete